MNIDKYNTALYTTAIISTLQKRKLKNQKLYNDFSISEIKTVIPIKIIPGLSTRSILRFRINNYEYYRHLYISEIEQEAIKLKIDQFLKYV